MGYDDGECVVCRLENAGGNVGAPNYHEVCLTCLDERSGRGLDYRLFAVLKERLELGEQRCALCARKCRLWFNVSMCDEHVWAPSSSDSE